MNNPAPNPYRPTAETARMAVVAQADWATQPDGRISLTVALTEQDVKRHFVSSMPLVILVLLTILPLLLLALGAISTAFLVLFLCFFGLLTFLRLRFNWKMALRQSPRLLEPATGYITAQGIFLASDGSKGYSRWDDLHSIRTTKACVLISAETWRLVSMIIPWTSFSDPGAAQQALRSVVEQRKNWRPTAVGDPRLRESPADAPMFQPDGPHVSYDGDITFAAIAGSAPGKKLKRAVHRWIPIIAIVFVVAGLTVLGGLMSALLIGFPLLVFGVTMIVHMSRNPLIRKRNDGVAFRTQGWFCPSSFFLQSVTGQSLREWRSVDHQWHNDAVLCICLPGVSEGWFFFSRSQFDNEEDYQQACRWAEAGLG